MNDWEIRFNEMIEFIEGFIGRQEPADNKNFNNDKLPEPLALFYRYLGERMDDIVTYNN